MDSHFHQLFLQKPPRADVDAQLKMMGFLREQKLVDPELADDLVLKLCEAAVYEEAQCGTVLDVQGRPGREYIMLLEGKIGIIGTSDKSSMLLLANPKRSDHLIQGLKGDALHSFLGKTLVTLDSPCSVGEASVLTGGKRMASIVCFSNCKILIVGQRLYHRCLAAYHSARMKMPEKIAILRPMRLCNGWNTARFNQFSYDLKFVDFKKNEIIAAQGEKMERVLIICTGQVQICEKAFLDTASGQIRRNVKTPDPTDQQLSFEISNARQGSLIGDVEAFTRSKVFQYTCTAVTETRTLEMTIKAFKTYFATNEDGQTTNQILQEMISDKLDQYERKFQQSKESVIKKEKEQNSGHDLVTMMMDKHGRGAVMGAKGNMRKMEELLSKPSPERGGRSRSPSRGGTSPTKKPPSVRSFCLRKEQEQEGQQRAIEFRRMKAMEELKNFGSSAPKPISMLSRQNSNMNLSLSLPSRRGTRGSQNSKSPDAVSTLLNVLNASQGAVVTARSRAQTIEQATNMIQKVDEYENYAAKITITQKKEAEEKPTPSQNTDAVVQSLSKAMESVGVYAPPMTSRSPMTSCRPTISGRDPSMDSSVYAPPMTSRSPMTSRRPTMDSSGSPHNNGNWGILTVRASLSPERKGTTTARGEQQNPFVRDKSLPPRTARSPVLTAGSAARSRVPTAGSTRELLHSASNGEISALTARGPTLPPRAGRSRAPTAGSLSPELLRSVMRAGSASPDRRIQQPQGLLQQRMRRRRANTDGPTQKTKKWHVPLLHKTALDRVKPILGSTLNVLTEEDTLNSSRQSVSPTRTIASGKAADQIPESPVNNALQKKAEDHSQLAPMPKVQAGQQATNNQSQQPLDELGNKGGTERATWPSCENPNLQKRSRQANSEEPQPTEEEKVGLEDLPKYTFNLTQVTIDGSSLPAYQDHDQQQNRNYDASNKSRASSPTIIDERGGNMNTLMIPRLQIPKSKQRSQRTSLFSSQSLSPEYTSRKHSSGNPSRKQSESGLKRCSSSPSEFIQASLPLGVDPQTVRQQQFEASLRFMGRANSSPAMTGRIEHHSGYSSPSDQRNTIKQHSGYSSPSDQRNTINGKGHEIESVQHGERTEPLFSFKVKLKGKLRSLSYFEGQDIRDAAISFLTSQNLLQEEDENWERYVEGIREEIKMRLRRIMKKKKKKKSSGESNVK